MPVPQTHRQQSHQPERGPDPDVRRLYARATGGWSPLRPPDATLEPKDAPLHLHRARRYLHHRLAADAAAPRRGPSFGRNVAERGGSILFVGTKKQSQGAVEEQAKRVNMPFVNHRWLGGLLTNWRTISDRIDRLHDFRRLKDEGQLDLLPAKERIQSQRAREARREPRWCGRHEASAGRSLHRRPEEGAARGARGAAARPARRGAGRQRTATRTRPITSSPATTMNPVPAIWSCA